MRSAQCPCCGQETMNTNPFDPPSIQSRAQQLEKIIDTLTRERASLLRRINNLQPITKSLPNNVLSAIFKQMYQLQAVDHLKGDDRDDHAAKFVNREHSYQTLPRPRFPVWRIVGSVCSEWRKVARSTPQLWVTFSAEVLKGNIPSVASLLRLHLMNAGNSLLSVELDMEKSDKGQPIMAAIDPDKYQIDLERHFPLENLLFIEYLKHFKSICLTDPPMDWFGREMSHQGLETIVLRWTSPHHEFPSHNLTRLCRLHRVFLSNCQLYVGRYSHDPSLMLCWDLITVLDLHHTEYEFCVEVLVRCRSLNSYKMVDPTHNSLQFGMPERRAFPSTLPLQHLEQLTWTFCGSYPDHETPLFRILRLPSIKSITFHGRYKHVIENNTLTTFFSRLPSSFKSLSFHEDRGTANAIEHLLLYIPKTLEHLLLERCCGSTYIVPFLFPDTTEPMSSGRSRYFLIPGLTHLECRTLDIGMGIQCTEIKHQDGLALGGDLSNEWDEPSIWEFDWLLDFIKLKARLGLGKRFHLIVPYENTSFYDRGVLPTSFCKDVLALNKEGFDVSYKFGFGKS